jgi:hypothetical protein
LSRLRGQRRRSRSSNKRQSRALRREGRRGNWPRAAEKVKVLEYTLLFIVVAGLRAQFGRGVKLLEIFGPAEAILINGVVGDRGDRGLAMICRKEDVGAAICARRDLAVVEDGDGLLRENLHRGEKEKDDEKHASSAYTGECLAL